MSSTVLVTGGAGYIGSHTVQALLADGFGVVVLDNLEVGSADAVAEGELVVGDIGDTDLIKRLCREHDFEAVVHFAAHKRVAESMADPGRYFDNNVARSSRLIDAVVRGGVRNIVFSSSCSVYGTPETVPVDEQHHIAPESVYAETKAMTERMLRWYDRTRQTRSMSLRYFNAAGASLDASLGESWDNAHNLIPAALRAALLGSEPLSVFGTDYPTTDGTCIRDYVHVIELAAAHVAAVHQLRAGTETAAVNLGTGVGSSVYGVIAAIERITGCSVPIRIEGRRRGDPTATYADPRLAAEVLGWRAKYGLDDIITTAMNWHQQTLARNAPSSSATP